MTTHAILTAVNRVHTLYGADAAYKLKHDEATQGQWWVLFEDKLTGSGWQAEYEGTFIECLDMIREYDKPNPDANLF